MGVVVSFIYRVIKFPHEWKIVTINQLSYCRKSLAQPKPNIPMVDNSMKDQLNDGVGLYPSLMGTFSFPAPKIHMISFVANDPLVTEVPFKTSYVSNPWTLPSPNDETPTGMVMPLSVA